MAEATRGDSDFFGAMATAWGLIQEVAHEHLPPEVLQVIREHVANWDGEAMVLGRVELEPKVAHLPKSQRQLALQGLTVACEAYQVDRKAMMRATDGHQAKALALVAYASFTAALRILSWLPK